MFSPPSSHFRNYITMKAKKRPQMRKKSRAVVVVGNNGKLKKVFKYCNWIEKAFKSKMQSLLGLSAEKCISAM